jgi:hypothetical protein
VQRKVGFGEAKRPPERDSFPVGGGEGISHRSELAVQAVEEPGCGYGGR